MSKATNINADNIEFLDGGDAKVGMEADGASTIKFTGDDGSEVANLKNAALLCPHNAATSSPFTATTAMVRIGIRNTPTFDNPFYVDLPQASTMNMRTLYVKDEQGNAGTYPIHVRGYNQTELIDSSSTLILNVDYQSVTLYSTGIKWHAE